MSKLLEDNSSEIIKRGRMKTIANPEAMKATFAEDKMKVEAIIEEGTEEKVEDIKSKKIKKLMIDVFGNSNPDTTSLATRMSRGGEQKTRN